MWCTDTKETDSPIAPAWLSQTNLNLFFFLYYLVLNIQPK
jgi:hypothetical protein